MHSITNTTVLQSYAQKELNSLLVPNLKQRLKERERMLIMTTIVTEDTVQYKLQDDTKQELKTFNL